MKIPLNVNKVITKVMADSSATSCRLSINISSQFYILGLYMLLHYTENTKTDPKKIKRSDRVRVKSVCKVY